MATVVLQCICSHLQADHTDGQGDCNEPTGRCECPQYIELCPKCAHSQPSHAGTQGRCTRVIKKTQQPCGCRQYATEEGN